MRVKSLFVLSMLSLMLVACGSDYEQLASGYLLRTVESGGGEPPGDTDAIKVHMKIELEDSLIVDSRDLFPIGRRLAMNNMWPEFKDILSRVGKGDSIQVQMSLPEYAKLEGRSAPLKDSSLVVTMSMRVLDVDNEASLIERMVNDQLAYEIEQIEKFVVNNNLEAERTDEGIYYIISREGEGEYVKEDDTVVSNFTLKLLNGKVLSSTLEEVSKANDLHTANREYEPYIFTFDAQKLLEGWVIGLPKLRAGGAGTLIIPSRYAYGSRSRAGVVPPNATLIYDLEILELK